MKLRIQGKDCLHKNLERLYFCCFFPVLAGKNRYALFVFYEH